MGEGEKSHSSFYLAFLVSICVEDLEERKREREGKEGKVFILFVWFFLPNICSEALDTYMLITVHCQETPIVQGPKSLFNYYMLVMQQHLMPNA